MPATTKIVPITSGKLGFGKDMAISIARKGLDGQKSTLVSNCSANRNFKA